MKQSFIVWPQVFTPAELDAIEEMGDAMMQQDAGDAEIRVTKSAWLGREARSALLYDRIAQIMPRIIGQFFHFDVTAVENIRYGVCQGGEGDLHDWHIDYRARGAQSRKISFNIQLSDPSRYEGGALEFRVGPDIDAAPRERGAIIAFPSFFLHRLAPVTSGRCKALSAWATGPEFR